ncbi:hypothetical protein PsYK624_101600 [Phanerochaete sordida]|uniref:Uncharacterized protein n=1 Tax=Phanerochaete sordida TaxID=48140 RepID=A0A9P3GDA9_9APHY|nr:hypothetical protein PsYK624_101600 [Phanerochaete sordida]
MYSVLFAGDARRGASQTRSSSGSDSSPGSTSTRKWVVETRFAVHSAAQDAAAPRMSTAGSGRDVLRSFRASPPPSAILSPPRRSAAAVAFFVGSSLQPSSDAALRLDVGAAVPEQGLRGTSRGRRSSRGRDGGRSSGVNRSTPAAVANSPVRQVTPRLR